MKIYIASSWKHKHGVEMLTALIREEGHEVVSWIENCSLEGKADFVFENWVHTEEAEECFKFDINGATTCNLFVYYGASGMDACCEMGAAWAKGIEIIALYSKGESLGLMRKMITIWYDDFRNVLLHIKSKVVIENVYQSESGKKQNNVDVNVDFNGTDKIQTGQFVCLQCATPNVMNADCVNLINKIGNSVQPCSNCGYDNWFDLRPIVTITDHE